MTYTVVVENENGISSGTYVSTYEDGKVEIGDVVTITPDDENGMPSDDQTGTVVEIIEE